MPEQPMMPDDPRLMRHEPERTPKPPNYSDGDIVAVPEGGLLLPALFRTKPILENLFWSTK